MSATIYLNPEKNRLMVSGDLNFKTVPNLLKQSIRLLAMLNHQPLTFDLSHVVKVNSAGLALMVEWVKYAENHQKKIYFLQIPQQVSAIAKALGVKNLDF